MDKIKSYSYNERENMRKHHERVIIAAENIKNSNNSNQTIKKLKRYYNKNPLEKYFKH